MQYEHNDNGPQTSLDIELSEFNLSPERPDAKDANLEKKEDKDDAVLIKPTREGNLKEVNRLLAAKANVNASYKVKLP